MTILVIGPSGVGKSDYGEHAAQQIAACQFFDLDDVVSTTAGIPRPKLLGRGADAFLMRCQNEVGDILRSGPGLTALVAVGAGALLSCGAGAWLSAHPGPTIAVVASEEEVYKRGWEVNRTGPFPLFKAIEYSAARQALYQSAKYQCNVTGLSLDKARAKFVSKINEILRGRLA